MIQFQAKHIKSLTPFMANDSDPRYYLRSIRVEPHAAGGAILVASDGTIMMCIRDQSALCSEAATFMIGGDATKFCGKRAGLTDSLVQINPVTERLIIIDGAGEELFLQPGKCIAQVGPHPYPAWQRVMPKFDALQHQLRTALATKLIAKAANAHPGERHHMPHAMRFWQAEADGVTVVEYDGFPDYMVLIMPVRATHTSPAALDRWSAAFGAERAAAPAGTA